ncbi:MAG TPA: hypothetical protein VGF48_07615 [Thermoanaerobaculia bacterium]|jgi:hypothetical protein
MGQIVFVTLFLGLAIGRVPVELLVTGDVVKVELVLDRQVVATIEGPPWKAPVDLGFSLAPHRLEARGYDATGRLITSAEQKVNAPASVRELQLVMERRGADAVARILWTNLDALKPDKVEARIDNHPVIVKDDLTVPLPRLDAETVHLLEVTVRSDAGDAEAQLVFGGMFEDSASASLTAVPVRVTGRRVTRDGVVAKVNDAPVRVMALDDLPAEVIFVREPLTMEFAHLAKKQIAYESLPGGRAPSSTPRIIGDPTLATQDRVRFIWPVSRSGKSGANASLFYPSRTFTTTSASGIGALLGRVSLGRPATELRFADAIAVAGWQAAQSQRPRAVVLVLGSHLDDASRLKPEQARNYLERLGVPLYVWSVMRDTAPAVKVWGHVVDVRTGRKLRDAVEQLRRDLDTQRILWVEGDYLATEVEVAHERVTALVR